MARLRRTLTTLLLAAALLPLNALAVPADTVDAQDQKVEIMTLLNSNEVAKQEQAVRLISNYAHTGQFDADFYRVMVTPLQALVARGETESLRIMSVSALYSIGSDRAMRGLKAQSSSLDSKRVAEVTERALTEYEADRGILMRTRRSE